MQAQKSLKTRVGFGELTMVTVALSHVKKQGEWTSDLTAALIHFPLDFSRASILHNFYLINYIMSVSLKRIIIKHCG